ncbi:phosphotransferase family enzyme [Streptomyces sp. 846.5]|nr:phosphotransferase [Streptomyces sp. 846.5]TDU01864.1 phosphotransferase family enzyme [Streptomyces sp. 846.5]
METVPGITVTGGVHIGRAAPDAGRLAAIGRAVAGRDDLSLRSVTYTAVDYPTQTIATEALVRAGLELAAPNGDRVRARLFVKVLRSAEHWPMLGVVPPELRADFVDGFPWRLEIAAYTGALRDQLPPGMRLPELYTTDELGPGRAAMWLEDVDQPCDLQWDTARFARAAHLLGRMSARRRYGEVAPILRAATRFTEPGSALRYMIEGRIRHMFVPAIVGDDLWTHPVITAALAAVQDPRLIADLRAWTTRIDRLLAYSDTLPMTYAHGDASPQNLLVPAQNPDQFVAIDFGLDSPLPVGHDLGQLLVGLCHAGSLPADRLPEISSTILDAHADALAAEGHRATIDQIRGGYLSGLVLRSAFSAIPLETLSEPPTDQLVALWARRLRMTRALLDLADKGNLP